MSDETYCRLCALKFSIFNLKSNKQLKEEKLDKLIFDYLHIEIDNNDDTLPKCACYSCCDTIVSFYNFFNSVQTAQDTLKQIINSDADNIHLDTKLEIKNEHEDHNNSTNRILSLSSSSNGTTSHPLSGFIQINEIKPEIDEDNGNDLDSRNEFYNDFDHSSVEEGDLVERKKKVKESIPAKNKSLRRKKKFGKIKNVKHEGPFKCEKCSRTFSHEGNYKRHQKAHLDPNRYVCPICEKSFNCRQNLYSHKFMHRNETFTCGLCDKKFKTYKSLEAHKRTHLPNEIKKRFKCDQCEKKFTTKHHLNFHKKTHELAEPERNYICEQCGKDFITKSTLVQHKSTHLDFYPYRCETCSKGFKNKHNLTRHEKNHTNYELFKCEICKRDFRHKRALKRHATIHLNTLPYECEHCQKCFREKSYLKIHLRQHTGEKPYSCLECNQYFTNDSNFIKHLKGRHGLSNFSIAKQHQYPFTNYDRDHIPYLKYENTTNIVIPEPSLKYENTTNNIIPASSLKYENIVNIPST